MRMSPGSKELLTYIYVVLPCQAVKIIFQTMIPDWLLHITKMETVTEVEFLFSFFSSTTWFLSEQQSAYRSIASFTHGVMAISSGLHIIASFVHGDITSWCRAKTSLCNGCFRLSVLDQETYCRIVSRGGATRSATTITRQCLKNMPWECCCSL